jgi:[protein-PII] uridylyltransferase
MRDYYTHARNIDLLTRTVEQRLALLPLPKRLPSLRQIIRTRRQRANQRLLDGFRLVDGEIHPGSSRVFRDQPRRLMRVFLHAQQRGHRLHPDLAQLIRRQLRLVDRSFLRDPHVHETFLEILNQRGNVAPILRAMHEVGFLGKFIPEFGRLTCLVQHEFYHQYAADEHTLVCLAKLDQVWEAEQAPYCLYTEMFQNLEQPFLLYLALLLHDAGKAFETENHALLGGEIAMKPGKRLGLDAASLHSLRLVIENHLAMAQISQRRDLEDPAVIRKFAALIESPANLTLLTLHTFADSQGTSDQLWNGFKDTLLRILHHKAFEVLIGGTEFILAEARRREQLAAEVRRQLPVTIGEEEINAHFANLPALYFQRHSARDICTDLALIHRFLHLQSSESDNVLEPVMHWHNEPDRGYTVAKVCTWDRAGLFSKIAGTFTAAGLTILSAGIISRRDGIVLDTFCVMDATEGKPAGREQRERCESLLTKVLTGGAVDFESLIGRLQVRRPIYQPLQGERIPTRIEFDNTSSDARTLIEVETEDRLGLLYAISRKLAALDLDISVAKICTEKGAAIDSFYVREADGRKIESPERQREIERGLIKAVAALDKAD